MAVLLAASAIPALKAEDETTSLFKLSTDVRIDWQLNRRDDATDDSNTGFRGKYIILRADGSIVKGLTYSWRQRFNKFTADQSFFDSTDWLYVNYAIDRWNFQAGKQIVAIGGWEYDAYPVDIYGGSVFWNNIPCYQLGVQAGFDVTKRDRLSLQAVQSPFFNKENRNMYAYNLMWSGSHGFFSALYSANLLEYDKGRYISYLSLGNRFRFGPVTVELDYMNRAASGQTFFFKDCTVAGQVAVEFAKRWKVSGKVTYDVNKTDKNADLTVLPGTELTMAGGSVEFYPLLKNKTSLRLHAAAYYSWGRNANAADVMQSKTLLFSTGRTWHMNFLDLKRKK